MERYLKKRSKKAGLPPGSLVHIGSQRTEPVEITVFHYDEGKFEEKKIESVSELKSDPNDTGVTWINVDGVHQMGILEEIGKIFKIHPLVLEDIANTDQRPKMENFDDYLYLVARMLFYRDDNRDSVSSEQVSVVLGKNFVLSFQEVEEGDVFDHIRTMIRQSKGPIRKMGADYLAYSILDSIIDHYFLILEKFGERLELLEEELVTNPCPQTLKVLHGLKREMIFLRRSVWPLREVVSGLERSQSPLIKPATLFYLRDIYDHTIQVIDTVETYRDMLSGMLDIYLSSLSNRMNEVMKVLTIFATLFMPITFIVGVYGMNFHHMPELSWEYGYPAVWGVMILVVLAMVFYFRRKKWI
ncbi:MAG: magnesium/cobalt transporter CorA [bacterium]